MTDLRPLILIANDDGIYARGIRTLAAAAEELGDVWVVAPDREQSAVGHGISLDMPLRTIHLQEQWFGVSGTPADCVYLALVHLLPRRPALILSGINRGNNLADDVFYSGTVAAAVEGCMHSIPSLAVSLTMRGDLEKAGEIAVHLGRQVMERGLPERVLLNLNIPRELRDNWQIQVAPLGTRDYGRNVEVKTDPRGRPYYWIGGPELGFEHVPGTDCVLLDEGNPTLTPLRLALDDLSMHDELRSWDLDV